MDGLASNVSCLNSCFKCLNIKTVLVEHTPVPYCAAFLILMAVEVFLKPTVKLDLSYNSPIDIIEKDGDLIEIVLTPSSQSRRGVLSSSEAVDS
jgi:hypothetical protein